MSLYKTYQTFLYGYTDEQSEYFDALKNLIEQTYELNGQQKVILIVHSLGGLMTLAMLHKQDQKWKDKYIKLVVSLAGAWGGSTKAIKVFAIGMTNIYSMYTFFSIFNITVNFSSPSQYIIRIILRTIVTYVGITLVISFGFAY